MKSDVQIKADVEEELAWDPVVDEAHVGVSVHDAVVELTGTLGSHAEKMAAEHAALRVSGVQGVTLAISVAPRAGFERADADIVQACQHALAWSSRVPEGAVRVQVEKGHVTLVGEVDWAYQRKAAETAVWDLLGVVSVVNEIRVRSRVGAADIRAGIQRALERQADREARRIDVHVDGSCVALAGRTRTWAEREAAVAAAWAAPGVTRVVNEIVVGP
ncbi:MAG TPA: BON domain-containing protein [Burkholderiaceae bacterium]